MRFHIRYEKMGGEWYYMIYQSCWLVGDLFVERCNTPETAIVRLEELKNA